ISSYKEYLSAVKKVFSECYRVLEDGRYCCVNISDIISDKHKYPIPAHYVSLLEEIGFTYRDDVIWKKPEGVGANGAGGAAKRFGVFIQNPYPMYYHPNNVYEHILIFRKGKFDYKKVTAKKTDQARFDIAQAKDYLSCDVWEFTPQQKNQYNELDHPAMFPDVLPETLIQLFTYREETVLDPFLGSGTTTKAARKLERRSVGYEVNPNYLSVMQKRIGFSDDSADVEVVFRDSRPKNILEEVI
ncbi:site-specific DNA-methyltransferase, partial [Candidatus Bathyarchaeota archaeon]|nr:site-specific DNA-methyltransferase [Candidatus Bathyarchaeota archaeon]